MMKVGREKTDFNDHPIIVVADILGLGLSICKSLKKSGFQTMPVPNAQEALEMARQVSPPLIITDWLIPGRSGPKLVEALRADPKLCRIPIILLGTKEEEESHFPEGEIGADVFLCKPFNFRNLLSFTTLLVQLNSQQHESQKTKSYLANIIASMPDSVIIFDLQNRISSVNDVFLNLMQSSEKKMTGLELGDLLAKDDILKLGDPNDLFNREEFRDAYMHFIAKNGVNFTLKASGAEIRTPGGQKVGYLICAHDDRLFLDQMVKESRVSATEREKAQDLAKRHAALKKTSASELQHSKDLLFHLSNILTSIPDSVIIFDLRHRISNANNVFLNLMKSSEEQMIGLRLVDLLAEDDILKLGNPNDLFGGEAFRHVNMHFIGKDGADFTLKASGSEIRTPEGQKVGYLICAHDDRLSLDQMAKESRASATEREKAEGISRLHTSLKESSERELQHAKELLFQADQLAQLGKLIASIGHEISNPISLIKMSCETALSQKTTLEDTLMPVFSESEDAEKFGAAIQQLLNELGFSVGLAMDGTKRLVEISMALRTQSRLEEEVTHDVELNKVIEETLVLVGGRINFHHVEKTLGDLPPIACFRSKIGQVLTNLLANAADALTEKNQVAKNHGGERFQGHISVHTEPQSKEGREGILVVISDNGAGVPTDIRDKIFEHFFTTKPVGVGTGLGLGICSDILKSHGGMLSVGEDEKLGGARFEMWLPTFPASLENVASNPLE